MADFDLDNSRWYNCMMIGLACKHLRAEAECIIKRAPIMSRFDYEPSIGAELARSETELSEALLAVKLARKEYEKRTKPRLVAAE